MNSEQFSFAAIIGLQIFFPGHLPCNFFFYNNFVSEGGGVKIGSICDSP